MPKAVSCGFDLASGGAAQLVTVGPTLIVNIGFDPAFKGGGPVGVPNLAQVGVPALVDTGAGASFIDEALAQALGLPVVDRQRISGSNGAHEVNMYLAQIHVPQLPFTQLGSFGGVQLAAGGQGHRALIGRTFLRHFIMTFNGMSGEVELTLP